MTEAPLDTYIKSPPPADERSHFNYLEEQLTKLENVSKKHVVRIGDNNESAKALVLQEATARVSGDEAQATYTETVAAQTLASATALVNTETTARTTADSALASQITTLTATVGSNTSAITSESSARATADTALGTRIDNLVLTSGSSAAVIIDSEAAARATADTALGYRIDSLTTTVDANTAAISTEQTTRSTKDDALARQLFTMSSGSSRVYIATTAPSSSGRQPGDTWFDSDDGYKPYVWARSTPEASTGDYDWRDNSGGTFSNKVGNYAIYTSDISTLTTTVGNSTTGLVKDVSLLQSTVGNSTAGLVRDVTVLTETVGDSSSGLVKDVSNLTSTTFAQRVFRQTTAPSTNAADRKVGDLWFDTTLDATGNAKNTPYYWNGSAWIPNADNTRATTAALTTEQTARTTADSAVAAYALTASAGTGRVYTSDPGLSGRQKGDVWFKTEENFKPYVWAPSTPTGTDLSWKDNSSGAYTKHIGQIATVTTTANAAKDKADNLSYEWRVVGTTNGMPAGSIKLSGATKTNTDGTTSTASKIVLDANVTQITGDLIVAGAITGSKISTTDGVDTSNIKDNAVSSSWYQAGTNGYTTLSIPVISGRKYVIFAVYVGGQTSSVAGTANLDINYIYGTEKFIQTLPVVFSGSGLVLNVSFGYSATTGSFVNGLGGTLNYTLPSACSIASWTSNVTGTVTFLGKIYYGQTLLSQPVNLYIVELKK